MSRNRFVEPETVRLELSDGDWIEVKKELTYGEEQRVAGAALTMTTTDGKVDADFNVERGAIQRLYVWLVDWSFENAAGKRVKLTREAISNLQPDTVVEIDAALTAHIASVEAAKNVVTPTS